MVAPPDATSRRISFTTLTDAQTVSAWLPIALSVVAFVWLFVHPAIGLAEDWITDPGNNGYGLLLAPVAIWLAWRSGLAPETNPSVRWGTALLIFSMLLRGVASLAVEFYSLRVSMWLALLALIVFTRGWKQVRHWWLPLTLLFMALPVPIIFTNAVTPPLQSIASHMGAALVRWRHIPVRTSGNVIDIPGSRLFVAEACSGLRSSTALVALAVMMGGMYLATVPARLLLVLVSIPVAIVVNGIRVFLTAFLVYFVSPELGQGFMHESEGWGLFLVSFAALALASVVVGMGERAVRRWRKRRKDD
jgi:exosortase